jgi:hypothetical protein
MKNIQPVQIWVAGELKTASFLGARIINDDLATSAQFYYWLSEASQDPENLAVGQQLSAGNLSMDGEDYQNWDSSSDINEAAYIWIAEKLSLSLIP